MEQNSTLSELEVEALIADEWIRVQAHESRRGATGQETRVSWEAREGRQRVVRDAWVDHTRIRAVHLDE